MAGSSGVLPAGRAAVAEERVVRPIVTPRAAGEMAVVEEAVAVAGGFTRTVALPIFLVAAV